MTSNKSLKDPRVKIASISAKKKRRSRQKVRRISFARRPRLNDQQHSPSRSTAHKIFQEEIISAPRIVCAYVDTFGAPYETMRRVCSRRSTATAVEHTANIERIVYNSGRATDAATATQPAVPDGGSGETGDGGGSGSREDGRCRGQRPGPIAASLRAPPCGSAAAALRTASELCCVVSSLVPATRRPILELVPPPSLPTCC